MKDFRHYYGVDFSGARLAGRTIWVAHAQPGSRGRLKLVELESLHRLCGAEERDAALAGLVKLVAGSSEALWAIDFPFGLPVELMDTGQDWAHLMEFLKTWTHGAYEMGLWCLKRAKALGGANHVYRVTDRQVRTPFSCYHYRIIYQTFFGMRDVLGPLSALRGTAVLPFEPRRLASARRVVVEACPSSTLKRLGLPHQNYKQAAGGPLSAKRRRTRRVILDALKQYVELNPSQRRRIMRDPGGDALDAVIAVVGVYQAWMTADHAVVLKDARTVREGYIYA